VRRFEMKEFGKKVGLYLALLLAALVLVPSAL
jgi:hypothetical protein